MIRRILKWFALSGGVLIGLLGLFVVHTLWFKPVTLNLFLDREVLRLVTQSPQALTMIGVFDRLPVKFYQGKLDEISVARSMQVQQRLQQTRATLQRYDRARYDGQKALSYDIVDWALGHFADGERFAWHGFPVHQMSGIHTGLPNFMLELHPVRNARDIDFYLARLEQFPQAFSGTIELLRRHQQAGVIPPRFAVEKVLESMREFIDQPIEANPLHQRLLEKVDALDTFPAARRALLPQQLTAAIANHVYPAYREMIEYFEQLLPLADSNDGVWRLPDGDAYYAWQVRWHTTTDFSPAEIHAIGVSEVARVEAEMDLILCAEGWCDGTVGERMQALNQDPRFLFEDSEAGRAAILEAFREIITEIDSGLEEWFDIRPETPVDVRRVPEYSEDGSAAAYYMPPALDGSRPGVFYAKLLNVEDHPKFGLRTLAYHEAIPGHHFQIALQLKIKGLPIVRKLPMFTAYTEGWALYAERLAWEAGFQADPFDNLGRLQAELFRAVRLVVDTGMHSQRWSREQAIEYMVAKTGMTRTDVVAEIERYLVMPGQALAYKVGMMQILRLRQRARERLGEAFDIREFHNLVLGNGAMPLSLLERAVDEWIATRLGEA